MFLKTLKQWQRIFHNVLNLNLREAGATQSVLSVYIKQRTLHKCSFFANFGGCFLPDFHFLNLVETWNKSRGKFIQKNICDNDKDLPTMEYFIITPPVKVLKKRSESFILKPSHRYRRKLFNKVKYTNHK